MSWSLDEYDRKEKRWKETLDFVPGDPILLPTLRMKVSIEQVSEAETECNGVKHKSC